MVLLPTTCIMWRGRTKERAGAGDRGGSVGWEREPSPPGEESRALGASYFDESEGRIITYPVRRLCES